MENIQSYIKDFLKSRDPKKIQSVAEARESLEELKATHEKKRIIGGLFYYATCRLGRRLVSVEVVFPSRFYGSGKKALQDRDDESNGSFALEIKAS